MLRRGDLSDEVSANVSGLGEDAAADPREQGDGRGAHAEAVERVGVVEDEAEDGEAEQRGADARQAHDGTTLEGDLRSGRSNTVSAIARGGGRGVEEGGAPPPPPPPPPPPRDCDLRARGRSWSAVNSVGWR